jgi:ppGpp synthetase/RelA/SpoT-type nucleotidyltranferase
MSEIIEKFVEQYKIEYDHYYNLSKIVYEICEDKLITQGIKAITSFRPNSPASLKEKLNKRNQHRKYESINDIKNDICDLAGVRIALYFPNERIKKC